MKNLRHLLFISLLVVCSVLAAQDKRSYYHSSNNPSLDSAQLYINSNPALAFDYVLKALEIAIDKNDHITEAKCYTLIGRINFVVEQYDLAIENYDKAISLYSKQRNKNMVHQVDELKALAYEKINDYEKSEAYYQGAAETAKKSSNKPELKRSKKKLADIYSKKGEPDKAIKELEEVRSMDISDGDIREQYETNQQLIEIYNQTTPGKALELSTENEFIAKSSQDTVALVNTLQNRAITYENMGNSSDRLNTLQQSLEVRQEQNDVEGQSIDHLNISKVYLEQNQIDDAIGYLKESIKLSDQSGSIETKKEALKSLSSAYDRSGDYGQALSVYKEYVTTFEQAAALREQKILDNLQLMQSLSKRLQRTDMLENQKILSDRTIELLERENRINEKALKQQKGIIAALLLGMILLSITVFLVFKSSRQKRIANQLLAIRSLRSQMNPHFIFNALNSVNSYISKSDDRSANKYLTDFSKLMRAVMENSKFDFVSLTSEIDILQLYLKLEHHRFEEKFDYSFIVDDEIDTENIQIPPMLIQPYIENAVWHGLRYMEGKGHLKVSIQGEKPLTIVIEDNGIGRKRSQEMKTKNQQEANSTGMRNINNRLEIINQVHNTNIKVDISDLDANNQSGTKVIIEIN